MPFSNSALSLCGSVQPRNTVSNLCIRMFVETLLNFAGVSLTLFAIAHVYMWISHDKIIKPTVKCRYCRKFISVEVR